MAGGTRAPSGETLSSAKLGSGVHPGLAIQVPGNPGALEQVQQEGIQLQRPDPIGQDDCKVAQEPWPLVLSLSKDRLGESVDGSTLRQAQDSPPTDSPGLCNRPANRPPCLGTSACGDSKSQQGPVTWCKRNRLARRWPPRHPYRNNDKPDEGGLRWPRTASTFGNYCASAAWKATWTFCGKPCGCWWKASWTRGVGADRGPGR